jgi:C4-dicarboxylate-specific signal transduction histidine kinase
MQAHSLSSTAARNPEPRNPFSAFTHLGDTTASASTVLSSNATPACAHGASALSHDAGNILAALSLYCDLLEVPGVLAPRHLHYAAELRSLAQRSGQLLQQAVSGSASLPQREPPCDAVATLRDLAPVLNGITQPFTEFVLALPPGDSAMVCLNLPAQPLERIVVNLVRNAAQAIAKGPGAARTARIRVALAAATGYLRLTVQDNGPGLTPAQAASFLRPLPLPAGAQRGFGHRIVHELATATGGQLSVRVKPGLGTAVSIKWPLATGEVWPC